MGCSSFGRSPLGVSLLRGFAPSLVRGQTGGRLALFWVSRQAAAQWATSYSRMRRGGARLAAGRRRRLVHGTTSFPTQWHELTLFGACQGPQSALHDFSAAGWIREEREKSRPAALGHLDAPPVTDERAEDSHGACERHAQAKIMVGQLRRQAVRRGEAP